MPEETINDIFTLSTSRYSEVRTFAQELLIKLMARYFSGFSDMINPLVRFTITLGSH